MEGTCVCSGKPWMGFSKCMLTREGKPSLDWVLRILVRQDVPLMQRRNKQDRECLLEFLLACWANGVIGQEYVVTLGSRWAEWQRHWRSSGEPTCPVHPEELQLSKRRRSETWIPTLCNGKYYHFLCFLSESSVHPSSLLSPFKW